MTLCKVCGVTQAEQALAIAELGVEAIGLNFVAGAARRVALDVAARAAESVRPHCRTVGVFRDPSAEEVQQVLEACALDYLQFHGSETAEFCASFGLPYIKTVGMTGPEAAISSAGLHPDAAALLLDTVHAGASGGTGQTFDWRWWPKNLARPLLLAGGLNPGNVEEAIQQVSPCAVDVSSGVEDGSQKGVKDLARVRQFVEAVSRADGR